MVTTWETGFVPFSFGTRDMGGILSPMYPWRFRISSLAFPHMFFTLNMGFYEITGGRKTGKLGTGLGHPPCPALAVHNLTGPNIQVI